MIGARRGIAPVRRALRYAAAMTDPHPDVATARAVVDQVAAEIVAADDDTIEALPGWSTDQVMAAALQLTEPPAAAVLASLSGAARTVRETWMRGHIAPVTIVILLGAAVEAALDDLERLSE